MRKACISIEEIEWFFRSELQVAPDLKHSLIENRFIAIGRRPNERPMIVAFTFRGIGGELFLRPISARYMHEKEIAKYEKTFPKT